MEQIPVINDSILLEDVIKQWFRDRYICTDGTFKVNINSKSFKLECIISNKEEEVIEKINIVKI